MLLESIISYRVRFCLFNYIILCGNFVSKDYLSDVLSLEAQQQFAVIARLRAGVHSTLSSAEIILDMREQLRLFQAKFNIICSHPNLIIKTTSTAF